jgi:hypothetical protein
MFGSVELASAHRAAAAGTSKRASRHMVAFGATFALVLLLANVLAVQVDWLFLNNIERLTIAKRKAVRARAFTVESGARKVVVLGDSRLTCGLYPSAFDRAAGLSTTTLNLALPSHDVIRHYYQLKDYVDAYGSPAYVILELRPQPGVAIKHPLGAGWRELFDYAAHDPSSRSALFHALFPASIGNRPSGTWWPGVRAMLNLKRLHRERQADLVRMIGERGVFWWSDRSASLRDDFHDADDRPDQPPPTAFDSALQPALTRFLEYAERYHIKILLVTAPYRAGSVAPLPQRPAIVDMILREHPNVRQAPNGWQVKLYPNRDFFNRGHLNESGAVRYSQEIAAEFRAAYADDES